MDEQNVYLNYSPQPGGKSMKKKVIIVLICLLLIVAGRWASTVSFVEVSVDEATGSANINYQFYNKGSQKSSISSSSTNIKKRLTKGSYEVLARQGNKTFFNIIQSKGFFATSAIKAVLQPEKSRTFVGDNPENCMNLINNMFLSYSCGGDLFSNVKIHIPASADTPTYVSPNPNKSIDGSLEGIVKTSGGVVFALIQSEPDGESLPLHTLYQLGTNLSITNSFGLSGLGGNKTYKIKPYKSGFIVYDTGYTQALYYQSPNQSPEKIKVGTSSDKNLSATDLQFENDTFLALYSSNVSAKKAKTEVVMTKNGRFVSYIFNKAYLSGQPCGTNKLCLVGTKGLDVYDVSGSKAVYLYMVSDIITAHNTSSGFLVITKSEVIRLDVDNRSGFVEYSLGDFTYNSIQPVDGGYILSLTNSKGKKFALRINQVTADTASIDKKVAQLQKLQEVNTVSVNGNYIFISPNIPGDLVYDQSIESYDYDPVVKAGVVSTINQKIDQLGIDRKQYTIINTAE